MEGNIVKIFSILQKKMKTSAWAFKTAWNIDKKMLVIWFTLSISLSVLPAIVILFNQDILDLLTNFISNDGGNISHITTRIVLLGVVLTLNGLSARVNVDLIYMMMYDSYYLGMQEILMDRINKIELTDLLRKEVKDEYEAVFVRAGSLTDFISSFCTLAGKVTGVIMLLAVAFITSKLVFIVSIVYMIAVFIINMSFVEKLRWNTSHFQAIERLSSYYEKMPRTLGIAKEIRIFNLEEKIVKQWKDAYKEVIDFEKKRAFDMQLRNFVSNIVFWMFVILMILYSIFTVANGSITADDFLTIFMLCVNMYANMNGFASAYMQTDYGIFSLERQYDFIKNAPIINTEDEADKLDKVPESDIVFEAKNLEFCYGNDKPVLSNLNLKIKKNETIALVGLNGSGKTTLTKLLIGLYRPTSGELLFYQRPYSEYKRGVISSCIGIFFQDVYLFHTPLYENIAYGNIKNINNKEKILESIRKGGAYKILSNLPKGLFTIMGKDVDPEGVELSGGEKQLVAISRTLMSERNIMIFDEPAAKLDPIAEMEQFLKIKKELENCTAILISHRMGFARLADRIIVMENGTIIEEGTHKELMRLNGTYSRMFNEQAMWYENQGSYQ